MLQRLPGKFPVPPSITCPKMMRALSFITGTVDMPGYVAWLRDHGYNIDPETH